MKRIMITIEDEQAERLKRYAALNNHSVSKAASYIINRGMKEFVAPNDLLTRAEELKPLPKSRKRK